MASLPRITARAATAYNTGGDDRALITPCGMRGCWQWERGTGVLSLDARPKPLASNRAARALAAVVVRPTPVQLFRRAPGERQTRSRVSGRTGKCSAPTRAHRRALGRQPQNNPRAATQAPGRRQRAAPPPLPARLCHQARRHQPLGLTARARLLARQAKCWAKRSRLCAATLHSRWPKSATTPTP